MSQTTDKKAKITGETEPSTLAVRYDGIGHQWRETAECARLTRFFERKILKLKKLDITLCLGVGIGSFSAGEDSSTDDARSSCYHLAVFETVVELLSEKSSRPWGFL